jgi:hypothetical protein
MLAPVISPSILTTPTNLAEKPGIAGEGVKSLAERLRRERESQSGGQRVSRLGAPSFLGAGVGVAAGMIPLKYLSSAINSSIASERQAESAPSLPSMIQISGEPALGIREAAQMGGERRAQSWRLNLDVPVTHFWGKATLSAGYARSEAGTASSAEEASAPLQQNATIALRQEIQKGALSGSAQVAFTGADTRQDVLSSDGERDRNAKAEAQARLKLQLAPGISLTGAHQSQVERVATLQPGGDSASEAAAAEAARWAVARRAASRSNSEVGLEWKWSKSLSLSAGAGTTRSGQATPVVSAGVWTPQWLRDEDRANLALQRRTGGGSWGLKWSRGWSQQDNASNDAMQRGEDNRSDALSLQAERKMFGWLNMRGSWRLAGETNYLAARLSDQATREAEARISGDQGSLALRYSDWDSQSSLAGADAGSSGRREYGVRYEAGRNAGLGLAVEYSVRSERTAAATSNWKLGITYR